MTNRIWKLRVEELMTAEVGKKVEKKAKLKRRNKNDFPQIFFLPKLRYCAYRCQSATITQEQEI